MSPTALGKRKHREEEGEENVTRHGSTLFVSNIPYSVTSTDLQTLFSDIAPVRSAFVVLEPGQGVSKGVGYVSFAIKEDAQAAYDKISAEGISLLGRSLRAVWAENKPKDSKSKDKPITEKIDAIKPRPQPRAPHPRTSQDPLAIRTVILSGLPPSDKIDAKVLWKKVRKYRGAEKVDWPVKSENEEEDHTTANVLFNTPSSAQEAINKLHAHIFKGCLLSATLKKRLDTIAKPTPTKIDSISPSLVSLKPKTVAAPSHASRLIVRNLPFDATEQDLRAVFLPYGPIHSIHIPTTPHAAPEADNNKAEISKSTGTVRTKGFAFVWMLSKKDAERAIEGCNGMTIRAGMASSLAEDKQKKKKLRRIEKKMRAEAEKTGAEGEGGEAGGSIAMAERVVAVDWALSKDRWEEEKAKMDVDKDGEDEDVEMVGEGDDDKSDAESHESDSEEEGLGVHDSEENNEDEDSGEEDEEVPTKPQLPPPEAGTTLFIRNVPFTATEEELRSLFRSFGPLRYARITMDHSTGRSRGTGFACFWNKEDADKVVTQSELLRSETTGAEAPKKNPFTLPSILTPDPSSAFAQSLVLQGRTLDVVRAVTRDEAGKLREDGERKREKADKRNMYLLREGVIMPNTPASALLTPTEVERRTASFNARRALLKSNPSLYISRTRLSIRQLPIFVTEKVLKRLANHAIREFEKDVKAGRRAGLSADELVENQPLDVSLEKEEKEDPSSPRKARKGKHQFASTLVKQAKIVRQHERVDPLTSKGRSKGYGFIEMSTHADALRVLRWSNNNPDVGPLFVGWWKEEMGRLAEAEKGKGKEKDEGRLKRLEDAAAGEGSGKARGSLVVEFSIENVQVVKRRAAGSQVKDKPQKKEKK